MPAISSYATLMGQVLVNIADAIRYKRGTSASIPMLNMASEIMLIDTSGGGGGGGGGDSELTAVQKIIMGWPLTSIPQDEADEIVYIRDAAFSHQEITVASFPNCTQIGSEAFRNCSNLVTLSFPICTTINSSVFITCPAISTADFPKAGYIGRHAFNHCTSLKNISFPSAWVIRSGAFGYCTSLVSAYFPLCEGIWESAFTDCTSLKTASFPKVFSIHSYAFCRCTQLSSLYLMNSKVASLSAVWAFSDTPLSSGGSGKIYVPSSLYNKYRAAPNWSLIKSRIVSM